MIPSNFQTFQSHSFATVGLSGLVTFNASIRREAQEEQTNLESQDRKSNNAFILTDDNIREGFIFFHMGHP